jgi:hypothetical protein
MAVGAMITICVYCHVSERRTEGKAVPERKTKGDNGGHGIG